MPSARTSLRAEQVDLRARMRALGLDYDEVAAEFARRYRLRPRAAYRHAYGWTLQQAADQVNTYTAQAGLDPVGRASMTASHLCEYEQWPAASGRKPTPHVLALLAHTYNTDIHRLLDIQDYEHFSPAERLLLDKTAPGHADAPDRARAPEAPPARGLPDGRRTPARLRPGLEGRRMHDHPSLPKVVRSPFLAPPDADDTLTRADSSPFPGYGGAGAEERLGAEPLYPGFGWPGAEAYFFDRVYRACADRHRGATIQRIPGDGLVPAYLDVLENDRGVLLRWPVGIAPNGLDRSLYDAFADQVDALYRRDDRWVQSELVCGGRTPDRQLVAEARRHGILVRSIVEFEQLWDPGGYLLRQNWRLDADEVYPSSLYVRQRYVPLDAPDGTEPAGDVLGEVLDALDTEPAQFVLVLGDFGHGKTFLLRELARQLPARLPHLVPVLVELRSLEKSHKLDVLLTQHMTAAEEYADPLALRRMLERGQLVLLFDGFDELALRVTYDRAAEHLATVLSAVVGKAKVVLTSRHQHFATDDQWRDALSPLAAGRLLVRLGGFDDDQILDCLVRLHGGDERKARARFDRISNIKDLLGLSRNPRMLSFIADLGEEELRAVEEGGQISSADLYDKLLNRWLRFETGRSKEGARRAVCGLDADQLRRAVTALASNLWETNDREATVERLEANARDILTTLTHHRIKPAEAAYIVGAGSLLVRRHDTFDFVHESVTEYLVAAEAARLLSHGGRGDDVLAAHEMSPLMVDFFCGAAGREAAVAWARRVLDDATSTAAARANALAVSGAFGIRLTRAQLAGQDLRGRDLSGLDLRFADLSGADLRSTRLDGADLTGAFLAEAQLTDATLDGVRLDGADLTNADLAGARLFRTDLRDARLDGSRWAGAAVVGGVGGGTDGTDGTGGVSGIGAVGGKEPAALTRPELAGVAVAGRDPARVVLQPLAAEARSVVFAADGGLLVAAWGRDVALVEPRRGRVLRLLVGHTGLVRSVASGPYRRPPSVPSVPAASAVSTSVASQGTLLASGGDDRTVRLWDAASGRQVRVLEGHTSPVRWVAFSPDGNLLASGGDDRTVRLWDVASGRQVRLVADHAGPVTSVAFDGSGTLLAAAVDGTVRVLDVSSGRQVWRCGGNPTGAQVVAFSPIGTLLASGDFRSVRLWDIAAGERPLWVGEGHDGGARTVAFAPDGTLASGGADMEVWVWDIPTGRVRKKLYGQQGCVWSVAFDPAGVLVAASGADNRVRVWDLASGEKLSALAGSRVSAVGAVVFGPPAHAPAGGGTALQLPTPYSPGVAGVRRTPAARGARLLASAGEDRSMRLWEVATGRCVGVFANGHFGMVHSIVFSPDGTLLASADDRTVRLWEVATGQQTRILGGGDVGQVYSVVFGQDGVLLAAAGNDRTVRIWKAPPGKRAASRRPRVLGGHHGAVRSAVFGPRGTLLASADSRSVRLWEAASGKQVCVLDGDAGTTGSVGSVGSVGRVGPLAFSPGGDLLAAGGCEGSVRLWDVASGRQRRLLGAHGGPVRSVAFSPDGSLLASAGDDRLVRVRNVGTGEQTQVFEGHFGAVSSVVFSPDGALLASGAADLTVRVWELRTGRLLATLVGLDKAGWAVLLPGGAFKLAGNPGGCFWWAVGRSTFGPGELDGFDPAVTHLGEDAPIPGLG